MKHNHEESLGFQGKQQACLVNIELREVVQPDWPVQTTGKCPYARLVASTASVIALVLTAALGIAIGAAIVYSLTRRQLRDAEAASAIPQSKPLPQSPFATNSTEMQRMLAVIASAAMIVDSRSGEVLVASQGAYTLGLVHEDRIATGTIAEMVTNVHRSGRLREEMVQVRRTPFDPGRVDLETTVAPIDEVTALVLAEDVSNARRVDEVRRDFVINVSHELKTPVGALNLLAEAVLAGADEPDEVRHFAERMRVESGRLANLVTDLVDLSRLQGEDPMQHAEPVDVDKVINEAVDSMRTTAQSKEIDIVVGGDHGLKVYGVEGQLVTALRNLLANAVIYSPEQTRVAVGCRQALGHVEITVTDQGIGIPASELDRVFERFYRVDQARSRETGGTGLGLSIVKHVCQNHGGSVAVWSVEGEGSTFTLRLPTLDRATMVLPETSQGDKEKR